MGDKLGFCDGGAVSDIWQARFVHIPPLLCMREDQIWGHKSDMGVLF